LFLAAGSKKFGAVVTLQSRITLLKIPILVLTSRSIAIILMRCTHWKNESVDFTLWRRNDDVFRQARSFDVRNRRFRRFHHLFYGFVFIFAEKRQMPRLRFELTTLGSDFSIIIFSVLAVTATRHLVYAIVFNTNFNDILNLVDFWKRGEYDLSVVRSTLCFFECIFTPKYGHFWVIDDKTTQ
jgi:hypothetical protein